MYRSFRWSLSFLAVVLGCSGGGGTNPDVAPPSADAPVAGDTNANQDSGALDSPAGDTAPLAPIVKEGVRVLPSSVTIVKVEADGQVTLRGAVPVMKTGDVIVSGAGAGLARKVKSVSMVGSDTVLMTEPAALTDIFQQAELHFTQIFNADQVVGDEPPAEAQPDAGTGTVITAQRTSEADTKWISVPFDVALLTNQQGSVRFHGEGNIGFEMDFDFKIVAGSIQKLRVVPTLRGNFSATFDSDLNAKAPGHRFRISYIKLAPIQFLVGPVPVVLQPTIELMAIATLEVSAGFRMTFGADTTARAGFEWTSTAGMQAVADSEFLPSFRLGGAARMSGNIVVRPEVAVNLYDVVGVYANLDLPAVTAAVQISGSSASVTAEARLGGSAGWFVKAWDGKILLDKSVRVFDTAPVSLAAGKVNLFFNSTVDFSKTKNPNGAWTYGFFDSSGNTSSFKAFPNQSTSVDRITSWTEPTYGSALALGIYYNGSSKTLHPDNTVTIPPHTVAMHPGPNSEQAVLRFTAPVAGTYRVAIDFAGISGYNGAAVTTSRAAVFVNGDIKAVRALNQNSYPNDFSHYSDYALAQGGTIDMAVWQSNGSHLHDSTSVRAEIGLAP